MQGIRNILVHEYDRLDDIPPLIEALENLTD